MKIISINVGRPRDIQQRGKTITTSIFKSPVTGRVRVDLLNVAGDQQSDLTVHGGIDKAVYVYPSEHYAAWCAELPDLDFPWGAFGENFTTAGLLEDGVHIGNRFRIGTAQFTVTQPRMPCFKLALRFDRPDMVKRFLRSGRSGFYLGVAQQGDVAADDAITLIGSDANSMTVADIFKLYTDPNADPDLLRRASELPSLAQSWRDHFRERLFDIEA